MCSEVTKLYENAGIEQTQDITCGDCEFVNYPEENKPCNACTQYGIKHYPPLTAKKQIELIKWLMKYDEIHGDYNDGYGFSTLNYSGKYKKDFEESLASIINNELWQDLTPEEKQQVKGILE